MTEKQMSKEEMQDLVIDALLTPINLGENLDEEEKERALFCRLLLWGV